MVCKNCGKPIYHEKDGFAFRIPFHYRKGAPTIYCYELKESIKASQLTLKAIPATNTDLIKFLKQHGL